MSNNKVIVKSFEDIYIAPSVYVYIFMKKISINDYIPVTIVDGNKSFNGIIGVSSDGIYNIVFENFTPDENSGIREQIEEVIKGHKGSKEETILFMKKLYSVVKDYALVENMDRTLSLFDELLKGEAHEAINKLNSATISTDPISNKLYLKNIRLTNLTKQYLNSGKMHLDGFLIEYIERIPYSNLRLVAGIKLLLNKPSAFIKDIVVEASAGNNNFLLKQIKEVM